MRPKTTARAISTTVIAQNQPSKKVRKNLKMENQARIKEITQRKSQCLAFRVTDKNNKIKMTSKNQVKMRKRLVY